MGWVPKAIWKNNSYLPRHWYFLWFNCLFNFIFRMYKVPSARRLHESTGIQPSSLQMRYHSGCTAVLGTDLQGDQEARCLPLVFQLTAVEPMHQVGLQDVILLLVKLAPSLSAFTGMVIAAAGILSSVCVIVVGSWSTSWRNHQPAICVTVEIQVISK